MSDRVYIRRERGSARSSEHYKLEWYDDVLRVWKPARALYASIEAAAQVARTAPDRHWRLMRYTGRGYEPVLMPSVH